MDHHVPRAITIGLRLRGVQVVTAAEDGTSEADDSALLDRAMAVGQPIFMHDVDLLVEATRRQRAGTPFAGVVYAHPLRVSIGRCIEDLELMAKAGEPGDLVNQVQFLPL